MPLSYIRICRRIGTSLILLAALGCANPTMSDIDTVDTVPSPRAINAHFASTVIPQVRSCFANLGLEGKLAVVHRYERTTDGVLAAASLDVSGSTLDAYEETIAARCLNEATRNAIMSDSTVGATIDSLELHWNWPIPIPDGSDHTVPELDDFSPSFKNLCAGAKSPRCKACDTDGRIAKCIDVCSGLSACIAKGPSCSFSPNFCVTGFLFGAGDNGINF